jgi:hypothetical protein
MTPIRLLLPATACALLGAVSFAAAGCGPECVPATCAGLDRECGRTSDGCGGTLDCGTCPEGHDCSAGLCRAPCVPTTCEAAGRDCGRIPDGCGATLQCGSCAGSLVCGAGGTPNLCAEPPDPCAEGAWLALAKPLVDANCLACHGDYTSPAAMRRYTRMKRLVENGDMPPSRALPAGEKAWLVRWLDCGLPD